jgi:hypothetical protein
MAARAQENLPLAKCPVNEPLDRSCEASEVHDAAPYRLRSVSNATLPR